MAFKRIKSIFSSTLINLKTKSLTLKNFFDRIDHTSTPFNENAVENTSTLSRRRLFFSLSILLAFLIIYAMLFFCFPPHYIFRDTTTNGGDTGAHNYIAKFFIDNLLPNLKMTGWDMGWFAGMPMLTFYFPLPYLFIALLSKIFAYNIAFKLVTILGSMILPVALYYFGRFFRFRYPYPELAAIGAMAFLYMKSFTIYGGNFLGTFAGEFSYSISFGLLFLFLGTLYRGMERNKFDWLFVINCILLAMIVLSHLITVIALLIIVPSFFVTHRNWKCARYIIAVLVVGFFISAFWSVPFVLLIKWTPTMKWTNIKDIKELFPLELIPALVLGAVGIFFATLKKDKKIVPLLWTVIVLMALFFTWNGGRLYNGRFLPFIFIFIYLLAAYGATSLYWIFASTFKTGRLEYIDHKISKKRFLISDLLKKWFDRNTVRRRFFKVFIFGFVPLIAFLAAGAIMAGDPLGPKWARHNYEGYEGKPDWETYDSLMQYLDTLPYGRVMFEFNKEILQKYGTPRAFELIPFWTHQAGMEGLLVESSLTAPFHYLNQAELSVKPRGTVAGWKVPPRNYESAMKHLIYMNITYIMASSPEVISDLNNDDRVNFLKEIEPYSFYEIKGEHNYVDIPKSIPYRYTPENWVWDMREWYLNAANVDRPVIYDDGSEILRQYDEIAKENLDLVPAYPLKNRGEILWEKVDNEKIEFDTTGIGQPHIIKVSYFPNWKVIGAEGPFLVSPSFMMVIPTQEHVTLYYGMSTPHIIGVTLSIGGWAIVLAILIYTAVIAVSSQKLSRKNILKKRDP